MMAGKVLVPTLAAQTRLNRLGEKRGDKAYIAAALESPSAKFLVLADLKAPIIPSEDKRTARLRWVSKAELESAGVASVNTAAVVFLGEDVHGTCFFVANLSQTEMAGLDLAIEGWKPHVDLRSLALQGVLPSDELHLAAQSRGILAWHAINRCCGRCGAMTLSSDGGWRRRCSACNLDIYPRTDPAVIMLITHGDRCLLGHEHRFPEKLYSTLAGFVEAGDDIEHAVRREIKEEAGIEVGAVHYVASQPWPFPHSLMIGCWGEALTDIITVEPSELADARWFSREDVVAMMNFRHPEQLILPPAISMAHVLLKAYVDGHFTG